MLKRLIIIEGERKFQYDTEQEIVRDLIDSKYYEMSPQEKLERLRMKAVANSLNKPMEILEPQNIKPETDLKNKFVLLNARTFILSLLRTERIMLLERIDSNIYTKYLDKKKFKKNYIIVNSFVDDILDAYVHDLLSKTKKDR